MATKAKGKPRRQSKDAPAARISYRPQGKTLDQFHRSGDFVRILIGPLGSGKTYGAIMEILRQCHEQVPNKDNVRKSRWCIARNSYPDLSAATIPDVRQIVDKLNPDGWNMQPPVAWRHNYRRADGTSVEVELMFRSFDGPQDVKKARGMQLTGVWVDELAEFNKENFDMLIGRVKRYPPKVEVPTARFAVLGTSNACARDHWLAQVAIGATKPPGWWVGIQPGGITREGNTWIENANAENLNNLPTGYYLEQCGAKKESWIRQNLANEFVVHTDGRPIHPGFNESLHVQQCAPFPGVPLYVGIDFGRTPAATIAQRYGERWYVLQELVTFNMGADKFGEILARVLNEDYAGYQIEAITGDPAGSQMAQTRDETPFDLLELSGLHALPASTNDPEMRYATLDQLLDRLHEGQPQIVIDPQCTTLIRGLGGEYQFRRLQVVGREEYRDTPDKGPASHVCESLHYLLMGAGETDHLFDQQWDSLFGDVESWAQPDHIYE